MTVDIDILSQGIKIPKDMTEYEAANALVMDDDDNWVVAGEDMFGIKEFRTICDKCDHSYDCNMRSVLTVQCNFFRVTNKR